MKTVHVAVLGSIGAVAAVYLATKAAQGGATLIRSIGDQVDPTNPDNIAAAGINKVGGVLVTDPQGPGKNADGSWTLGGWWFDITNPETAQAVKDITKPVPPKSTDYWPDDQRTDAMGAGW